MSADGASLMSQSRIQVEIYETPIYVPGSGPPMAPITLLPPDSPDSWEIECKMEIERSPRYIVFPKGKPSIRKAVKLLDVLDWVSPRVLEDFEAKEFMRQEKEMETKDIRVEQENINAPHKKRGRPGRPVKTQTQKTRRTPGRRPCRPRHVLEYSEAQTLRETSLEEMMSNDEIAGLPSTLSVKRKRPMILDLEMESIDDNVVTDSAEELKLDLPQSPKRWKDITFSPNSKSPYYKKKFNSSIPQQKTEPSFFAPSKQHQPKYTGESAHGQDNQILQSSTIPRELSPRPSTGRPILPAPRAWSQAVAVPPKQKLPWGQLGRISDDSNPPDSPSAQFSQTLEDTIREANAKMRSKLAQAYGDVVNDGDAQKSRLAAGSKAKSSSTRSSSIGTPNGDLPGQLIPKYLSPAVLPPRRPAILPPPRPARTPQSISTKIRVSVEGSLHSDSQSTSTIANAQDQVANTNRTISAPVATQPNYPIAEYPPDSADDEDKQWKVNCILDEKSKKIKGKWSKFYLIDWVGDWKPTWEKASNVSNDLIADFETMRAAIILRKNNDYESQKGQEDDNGKMLNDGKSESLFVDDDEDSVEVVEDNGFLDDDE
jgi:hypothetical protein